nr:hypothetical protein [Paraburkholderia aspalathi]
MPCHHALEAYLHAHPDGTGIGDDPRGPLFRTIRRGSGLLSATPLPQANAYAMVRRRALAAGIGTAIGNHTFRAAGITAYMKCGGTLGNAAAMANHPSSAPRNSTTGGATTSRWTRSSGSGCRFCGRLPD